MIIPYGQQTIGKTDVKAVVDVLNSEFLTTGPKVAEFEKKFSLFVGARYAIAVSSGTAALHLACLAAGLKHGDELITSPMTFAASANCALYCGARPVFVDIKEENGLIDERLIEKKITSRTKIIIPVHYTGLPCDMKKIKAIAKRHNITIIEDACHALGSEYKGTKIGDCAYSDMVMFSFHPVKHITTGEGGMITTNSKELYEKLLMLRTHGITKDPDKLLNKNGDPWYYEMQELGFNYRITDFQCALGISQLRKVEGFIKKRISIAKKYDKAFSGNRNIEIVKPPSGYINTHHLYIIKVKDGETRLGLFSYLKEKNILCQVHYIPVYWHPYYQKLGYKKGICPRAEKFYERIISIPIYPGLKNEEQKRVIGIINDFTFPKRILAIIPARGGSKRIPRKNIRNFLGKPIIAYSIKTATESQLFDEIMVSTDDNEIARVAVRYGAKVPFFRSAKNSDDHATTAAVIEEALSEYQKQGKKYDYVCCIYPTAPFVTAEKLVKAKEILEQSGADSVLPVTRFSFPIQRSFKIDKNGTLKMNYPENVNTRSQDLAPNYHDAGQFYFLNIKSFSVHKKMFYNNTKPIIVSETEVQDIDCEEDWKIAEVKYKILSEKYDK
jgi:UDP-4-amino-4,6-dideoxy-N-acetyl-beta-L-altrosamine transaminase/pseudaminic acid cytidylyltransferase